MPSENFSNTWIAFRIGLISYRFPPFNEKTEGWVERMPRDMTALLDKPGASIFDLLCSMIQDKAADLKSRDLAITGFRFLHSARETFDTNTGLMLAALNPGNEVDMTDRFYTADGRNAYITEAWTASKFRPRMVTFMRRLFNNLGINEVDYDRCFDQTLTSNMTPLRSARLSGL